MVVRSIERRPGSELAEGQIWKLQHVYIQIVQMGKTLLHYRMMDFLGQRGVRTQISSVSVMKDYLYSRHARLMRGYTA